MQARTERGPALPQRTMIDTPVSQCDGRPGDARPASDLVEREAETDRRRSYLRSDGRVTLVTLYRSMAGAHATLELVSPSTRSQAHAAGHADREGG
jgi:hypothetical protein